MRRLLLTLSFALVCLSLRAQQYPELSAKLEQYFTALAGESAALQKEECDFLISSCQDSLVRQFVTLRIYDHYLQSKIMGDDAVAVHIAQKWLLPGLVAMHSPTDLLNAQIFVEFNRRSLIGCKAPSLNLSGPDGSPVTVPASGRYSVLYFYDSGCSSCKLESARLQKLVASAAYELDAVAIYVGADSLAWAQYRPSLEGLRHAWDPAVDSDWQRKYGVLQTPRMFLISPEGLIVGRGLDTPALQLLLNRELAKEEYLYGNAAEMARYDQLFAAYGDSLSVSHILEVTDYLAARTIAEGNQDAFKQVMGDLLYYLSSHRTEVHRDAVIPFVQKYIFLPEIWNTPADTAQVVSLGKLLSELTARTPVGSPVPDLSVPGVLRRKGGLFVRSSKTKTFALRGLRGRPSYLVFYSAGCSSCQELLSKVDALVAASSRARVLLVDMDALMSGHPELGQTLLDSFDLSALPFVLQLDRNGVVQHRYVQL